MNVTRKYINPAVASALLVLTALSGCFTGIERTPVIKGPSESKSPEVLTEERKLMREIATQKPAGWAPGKPFIVTAGRLGVAYAPAAEAAKLLPGDTLRFRSIEGRVRLSGDSITEMFFTTPRGAIVSARIESPLSKVMSQGELPVPFAIDADIVRNASSLLKGREVWTLRNGSDGRKYSRVKINDVLPGNSDYPLMIVAGNDSLYMVADNRSVSGRTFDNLFSLTDPRKRYPQISDKNWDLICKGMIALEMTREECRLALGAPADVERVAAYNGMIERWTYENGVYLVFTDGILTRFRR